MEFDFRGNLLEADNGGFSSLRGSGGVLRGNPNLTFADSNPDTITRGDAGGSWITDGFTIGQTITVAGSRLNNGTYTVADISEKEITLSHFGGVTTRDLQKGLYGDRFPSMEIPHQQPADY